MKSGGNGGRTKQTEKLEMHGEKMKDLGKKVDVKVSGRVVNRTRTQVQLLKVYLHKRNALNLAREGKAWPGLV